MKFYMKQNWIGLQYKVNECIENISEYNERNQREKTIRLPNRFVFKLVKIFKDELSRQIQDMKPKIRVDDLEELYSLVLYDQSKYIDCFN